MERKLEPTFGNGKICYIQIPAIDPARSADFYAAVFGWNIRRRDDGTITFDDGVGEVSGTWVAGRKPAAEANLLIYIMVESVSATLDSVTARGGKILQHPDENARDVIARFSDPAGNVFGLYEHSFKKN
jgi:predicted enzyme related to lactoylglutathione lyase